MRLVTGRGFGDTGNLKAEANEVSSEDVDVSMTSDNGNRDADDTDGSEPHLGRPIHLGKHPLSAHDC